jgi:hypothetical protein
MIIIKAEGLKREKEVLVSFARLDPLKSYK